MPRRVLIIGGSSTLGSAAARVLREENPDTLLWLTHHAGEDKELRERLPDASFSEVDLRQNREVVELFQAVAATWGALDAVVVAAGVGLLQPASHTAEEQLTAMFRVNVLAAFEVIRQAFPLLLKGNDPAVVLFSSTMGLVGAAGMSGYAASKAAVASLTRSLAVEWAPRKIRVNAVAPGVVPSPMVSEMFGRLTAEQVEEIRRRHPLGFGEPEDVAFAVQFLLSERARWITGVVLPVDGGYTAQ